MSKQVNKRYSLSLFYPKPQKNLAISKLIARKINSKEKFGGSLKLRPSDARHA